MHARDCTQGTARKGLSLHLDQQKPERRELDLGPKATSVVLERANATFKCMKCADYADFVG